MSGSTKLSDWLDDGTLLYGKRLGGHVTAKSSSGLKKIKMYHDGTDGNIETDGDLNLPASVVVGGVALKTTADINWHIATTGNDTTGDGTVGNPWLTRQHAYDLIPDVVAHKVTIHLAAGTYYDTATMSGNFIVDGGSVSVKGAVTQQLGVQAAGTVTGIANDSGAGKITVVGAAWPDYSGYWVRFITTTSPTALVIFKYVKIISNTADTLTVPIMRFTPGASTSFDIVSLDTTLNGATVGTPLVAHHIIERISNMQTAVQSWSDGLYYRSPITYDALNFVNGKSYSVYVSQANILFSGAHFGVTDPAINVNYWHLYIVTAATYISAFGVHMDGNSQVLSVGVENAIIDNSNVFVDYRTVTGGGFTGGAWDDVALTLTKAGAFTGLSGTFTLNIFSGPSMVPAAYTATWVDNNTVTLVAGAGSANSADVVAYYGGLASHTGVVQTASGSSVYFKEYYVLSDALHMFPWMTFISGAGSNGYISKGYVTYAMNILSSRFGGYVDSSDTNGIYGANNINLYNVISNGYAKVRSQTNAGASNLYIVDDTAKTHYYTNISTDNYTVSDIIKNQAGIVATTTLPVGYIQNSLTVAAPTTLTSTPTIAAGVYAGQRMSLIGTSDANTITLQDADTLAGSTLELIKGTGTVTLGAGDAINFKWNTATSKWEESGNTFMNMLFSGTSTNKNIYLEDDQADTLSFSEGTNKYLTFVTTNGAEAINLLKNTTAITQAQADNSTKLATTAYVDAAVLVENLWNRAGTVLSPTTAGDTMAAIGDISSADNATTWNYNIPVTGTDAGVHTLSLQIDGNIGLSIAATGNGAGGVGIITTSLGLATGITNINTLATFSTGQAITAGSYQIGRDADATNQLHFNVPTGAAYEWSTNDVRTLYLDTAGALTSTTSLNSTTGLVQSVNTVMIVKGWASDGATAVGVALDAGTALTVAGSKITSFKNNNVEKAYVDYLGSFSAGAGTALLPAYSFVGDPNTGFYWGSDGIVNFSSNGAKSVQLSGLGFDADRVTSVNTGNSFVIGGRVADGGISVKIGSVTTLTSGKILELYNDAWTTSKLYVDYTGRIFPGGQTTYSWNGYALACDTASTVGYFFGSTNNPITLYGYVATGASAIASRTGNLIPLTTVGAKISAFCSDQSVTERAFIDKDGGLGLGYGNQISILPRESVYGALIVAPATAGGAVDDGQHSYKVTFVTAAGESSAGVASVNANTGAGNNTVPLSNIPTGTAACTSRNIYRNSIGVPGTWRLLVNIAGNSPTATFNDLASDASIAGATDASTIVNTTTGTMSYNNGNIKIGSGTALLPAYSFAGDPNSGLYSIGADNIGLTLNGVRAVDFSTTRVIVTGKLATTMTLSTLAGGVTTFAASSNVMQITGDGGGNTVATITGGVNGQLLTLIFVDALVTITDTDLATAETVNLSAAFTSAANTTLQLVYNGNKWFEVCRSVNG